MIQSEGAVFDALVAGDEKKQGFLMGQIMKESGGKANPQEVSRLLRERVESARG